MRAVIAACAMFCAPVLGWADDAPVDCAAPVDMIAQIAGSGTVFAPVAASNGWCTIASAQINAAKLTDIAYRWTDTGMVRHIDIMVGQVAVEDHVFKVESVIVQDQDRSEITLQSFSARSPDGYGLTASGQFATDASQTFAAAFANAALQTVAAQISVTPSVFAGMELTPDQSGAALAELFDAADFGQIDRTSRRELSRFAAVLPNANGRLDLAMTVPQGVNIAGLVAPFIARGTASVSDTLGTALGAAQLRVRWNPGRM